VAACSRPGLRSARCLTRSRPTRATAAVDNHGLLQRVARLELQQQQQGAHVFFSPTALAVSYHNAVSDRVVIPSPAVTWFQPATPPDTVLDALRRPPAPDAPEAQVQTFMERVGQLFAAADTVGCLLLVGRSSTPTVGTRKPDLVAFLRALLAAGQLGAPRPVSYDVLHAVVVGELKHRRAAGSEGRFTAEEKAGVLSFLEDLVREQLWRAAGGDRARVVAFLCDGAHIIFFQCTFGCQLSGPRPAVSLLEAQECGPFPLVGEGAQLLTGLLKASPSQLGYDPPRCVPDDGADEIVLRACLGAGATSLGFAAKWQGRTIVLKQYHAATPATAGALAAATRAELDALRAATNVRGVCRLLGTAQGTAGETCVLLAPLGAVMYSLRTASPVATAAAPPSAGLWSQGDAPAAAACRVGPFLPGAAEFCDLVDALANLHAVSWVHRDPRPANFYRDGAGRFFLADLGSAAPVDVASPADADRPWAFNFGPLDALRALRDGASLPAPQPAHDFEQVARLVYVAHARDGDTLPSQQMLKAADLCAWWQARDGTVVLAPLLRAAAAAAAGEAEREQLKAAIRAVFPA